MVYACIKTNLITGEEHGMEKKLKNSLKELKCCKENVMFRIHEVITFTSRIILTLCLLSPIMSHAQTMTSQSVNQFCQKDSQKIPGNILALKTKKNPLVGRAFESCEKCRESGCEDSALNSACFMTAGGSCICMMHILRGR